MTAVQSDLRLAQREAIAASAWGSRFHLVQPRNPLFWLYLWAIVSGVTQTINYYRAGVPNYGGAIAAGAVLMALYTIPWLIFLHARDRYTGLPLDLLGTGFLWGALVATSVLAIHANGALLDLYAKWFGQAWAADWSAAFTAPLTEETSKALGFLVLLGLAPHLVRSAYDAFVLGAFIGLGFEVSEDLLYVYQGAGAHFGSEQSGAVIQMVVFRGASGVASHALFSAIFCTGLAWVIGRVSGGRRAVRGIGLMLLAMLFHGVWDAAGALGVSLFGESAGVLFVVIVAVVEIATVILVARIASSDVRRWIHAILAPEIAAGVLTADEVGAVAGSSHHERKYVRSIGDHRERKRVRRILDAAHELAQALGRHDARETPDVITARAEIDRLRTVA